MNITEIFRRLFPHYMDRISDTQLDSMWKLYSAKLAKQELKKVAHQLKSSNSVQAKHMLHQAFWEAWLACRLEDNGLQLGQRTTGAGPDIEIKHGSNSIWIEAIAPSLDRAALRETAKSRKQTAGYRNATPYLLRWSSAIATKVKKFSDYHSAGRIKEYDACVIAVNSALLGIEGQHGFSDHPTLVDIVMPVGAPYVTIDRKTGSIKNEGLSYTPKLDKVNRLGDEVEVPKGLFYSNTSKQISAVMSSNMTCFGPSVLPSPTLVLVHNPFAATPLPKKLISCDIEIMFERRDNAFHIEYL